MLELALEAGLPVVSCTTRDLLNLPDVLRKLTDRTVKQMPASTSLASAASNTILWTTESVDVDKELLEKFLWKDATLLLVNPEVPCPFAFDAGEVPVPIDLMAQYISHVTNEVEPYLRLSAGLSIKETVEVIKLAQARDGALTLRGFRDLRSRVAGAQQGLNQVDTDYDFYLPSEELINFVGRNQKYFLTPVDNRLMPRGILFFGPPGTGKTMGAKYIAKEWGVPLYRLNLSGALGKYVGESETNVTRVLATVDREEPCILLIDEAEKLFGEHDDSNVTTRILSQLLWWLQEHKGRVLTVITTNNMEDLPSELYRSGRIDGSMYMGLLQVPEAMDFAIAVLKLFVPDPKGSHATQLRDAVKASYASAGGVLRSYADITSVVYELIKAQEWV